MNDNVVMVFVSSILTLQLKYKNMRIYSEDKLRKKISVLRIGKAMNQLNDSGLIELTTCNLLLESFIKKNERNEFDKWLDNLAKKNGTTEY